MTWKNLRHARVMRATVAVVVITLALTGVASAGAATDPKVRVARTVHIENEYNVTWKITYRCPAGSWISMDGSVSQPDPNRLGGSFAYTGSAPHEFECSGRLEKFNAILFYPTGEATGLQPGVADASFGAHVWDSEAQSVLLAEFSIQREVRVKLAKPETTEDEFVELVDAAEDLVLAITGLR